MSQEIVVADIGGTHARFAIAHVEEGKVTELAHEVKMKTAGKSGQDWALRA